MKTAIALIAATISTQALAAELSSADRGRLILEENCSRCHAIGHADASANAQAPPFRAVVARYPADNLAESLAEGIVTGHPEMPEFVFEPEEIDAIIAYLDTLVPGDAD